MDLFLSLSTVFLLEFIKNKRKQSEINHTKQIL